MEELADKVHKQEEHFRQHRYDSHNHPYISSSEYSATTHVLPKYSNGCNFRIVYRRKIIFLLFCCACRALSEHINENLHILEASLILLHPFNSFGQSQFNSNFDTNVTSS